MKKDQIQVGSEYIAKVNGELTTIRVNEIQSHPITYCCTDLSTNRPVDFGSARAFREEVESNGQTIGIAPPHVIIVARAGTGKTTTGIGGLKIIKGESVDFTPSPQQQAIFDEFAKSQDAESIAMVAFNKSIATELQQRVPKGVDAMTMHSMGFQAVKKSLGYQRPNSWTIQDAISEIEQKDIREIRKYDFDAIKATEKLVSLSKGNLLGWDGQQFDSSTITDEELVNLAGYYDVDLNGNSSKVFQWVRDCLEKSLNPTGKIAFDDMIWLPIVRDLAVPQYDLLFVDEAQDLNRCQQALAKKAGKRLIFCGDDKQAIYGFAGADSQSLTRLQTELESTYRGVSILPLTVTRRCGKAIVEEARKLVPDFEFHESNGEGLISRESYQSQDENSRTYAQVCEDGDMVLCRVNAPLVSQCFRFLKEGRRANIQGRDVGQGLISIIKKQKATDLADLIYKLSEWLHGETKKENNKRNPNENRLIALQDRYDCLECFIEGQQTIEGVISKIKSVFSDDATPGIKFSSVHKAKGLEADRVFLLEPEGATIPHPMAKTAQAKEQEMNLKYVAITRAKEELVYVS